MTVTLYVLVGVVGLLGLALAAIVAVVIGHLHWLRAVGIPWLKNNGDKLDTIIAKLGAAPK